MELETLCVCLPYEIRIAVAMLAGVLDSQRRARKLLKFGGGTDPDELASSTSADETGEEIRELVHDTLGGVSPVERRMRDPDAMFHAARGAVADLEREMG
jgi:hypothetical protein